MRWPKAGSQEARALSQLRCEAFVERLTRKSQWQEGTGITGAGDTMEVDEDVDVGSECPTAGKFGIWWCWWLMFWVQLTQIQLD